MKIDSPWVSNEMSDGQGIRQQIKKLMIRWELALWTSGDVGGGVVAVDLAPEVQ